MQGYNKMMRVGAGPRSCDCDYGHHKNSIISLELELQLKDIESRAVNILRAAEQYHFYIGPQSW